MILTSAALAVFIVAYALIATERVHRVAAALGGVAGMVVIGLVDAETAFFEEHTGVDWNVIFLLFGMMIIVGVLKQTGLFEFLALWAAQRSGGEPYKLLVLLVLITAAVSPILDNVTACCWSRRSPCRSAGRLGLPPAPYLISLILASNIGGIVHPDRRPAQHHHRQPRRAELHRLPRPLAAARRSSCWALRRDGALALPQGPRRTRSTCTGSTTSPGRRRSPTVRCWSVPGRARPGDDRLRPAHRAPPRPVGRGDDGRRRDGRWSPGPTPRSSSRRSSGTPSPSSWRSSCWSARSSRSASSARSASRPPTRWATASCSARRPCSSARRRSAPSSTTSRTPPPPCRSSRTWSQTSPTPVRTARCGGPSSSAPTSAGTPPPSRPAPTSSCSGSPPRRASRSASGGSPGTASW